jgi:hypothetical protein
MSRIQYYVLAIPKIVSLHGGVFKNGALFRVDRWMGTAFYPHAVDGVDIAFY